MIALEYWINTQDKAPKISQFKPIIAKLKNPEAFTSPEKAWEVVNSAVKRFGSYGPEKAFETFSEPIKRAVQSVGGWQRICETELYKWDWLRKNFMDAYNDFGQEVKEQELLPTEILHKLQNPQERLEKSE